MKKAGQAKPRCGAGQSCGFTCIAAHETCTETLDGAVSKAAVEALRSHATAALATVETESTDFRGKSFDEVQSKFSANDAKHTIASTVVDHGGGITTQKVTLVASDGSGDTLTHTLLRMAADGDQPERIFTLADGAAKEYTDAAKHNYWNESRDAAVRAAISRPTESDAPASPATAAADSKLSLVQPYKAVRELGRGAFGVAELTDRGTVVKQSISTQAGRDFEAFKGGGNDFYREAELQNRVAAVGIAPKALAVDSKSMESELVLGKTIADLTDVEGKSKSDTARKTKALAEGQKAVGLAILKMHQAGVVHNDLNQGNIMVDESGTAKILDFGLSNSVDSADYFSRRFSRVEELIKQKESYPHPDMDAIEQVLKPQMAAYLEANKLAMNLSFSPRLKFTATDQEKQDAMAKRISALKTLDSAYGAELDKRYGAKSNELVGQSRAAKLASEVSTSLVMKPGDFIESSFNDKKADPDKQKAAFVGMFPSLANKADDSVAANDLRRVQSSFNYGDHNIAKETEAQQAVIAAEDKLYERQPSAKTVDQYKSEFTDYSTAWGVAQGLTIAGADPSRSSFSQRFAAHDITHAAIHEIYGGDSDAINADLGGIMTKEGKKSLLAEEALGSMVENLSRGMSPQLAVSMLPDFISDLAEGDIGGPEYVKSSEFKHKLAQFAVKALAHNDFGKISQIIHEHNRISKFTSTPQPYYDD